MMVSGGPELGTRKKNTFLITQYNYSIIHEHALLIFRLLIFSCVLDLKEKSRETRGTSFLTLLRQGTIVILPARPVLELSKKKKGTEGPNHVVILC